MTATQQTSRLIFDGQAHQISLVDSDGTSVGTWPAYNNVDSHATIRALANRSYSVEDRMRPHAHQADPNGPYGSHGIVRFNVAGHPGIGVHSGRANARHLPGPQHPTMGCIRTSDDAMQTIAEHIRNNPLSAVEVVNNGTPVAVHASQRHRTSGHIAPQAPH